MKKVFYLSVIFMFSVSLLNATNITNTKIEKEVKIEKNLKNSKNSNKLAVLKRYKGICLDGTTFHFIAASHAEAQGYVNGYCRGLRMQ